MSRWQDAAYEQEHMLRNIDGYFGDLLDGYQEAAFGGGSTSQDAEGASRVIREIHRELLQRADPIYVADNPMILWEHARESFEPEPIHATDLVVPCGFALLPRATRVRNVEGKYVAFRAIAWMPISNNTPGWHEDDEGNAVWVSLLSHFDDVDESKDDDASIEFARHANWRWSVMHGTALPFERRVWEEGDYVGDDSATVRLLFLYVQSFWRLMGQLVPVRTVLHRQARKQRARQQLVPDVTVIHLRRERSKPDEDHVPSDVDWSHQWLVRGHWRKQPYGSRTEPSYKQIWIAPYVKGPEEKPLKITKRAFEFDR